MDSGSVAASSSISFDGIIAGIGLTVPFEGYISFLFATRPSAPRNSVSNSLSAFIMPSFTSCSRVSASETCPGQLAARQVVAHQHDHEQHEGRDERHYEGKVALLAVELLQDDWRHHVGQLTAHLRHRQRLAAIAVVALGLEEERR